MSRADDIKAKAARIAEARRAGEGQEVRRSVPQEEHPADPEERPARSVRTRPVRLSVDIAPRDHVELVRLTVAAAEELGVARVHGQEVVRAVLRRLLADPALQRQVLDDVRAERRAR